MRADRWPTDLLAASPQAARAAVDRARLRAVERQDGPTATTRSRFPALDIADLLAGGTIEREWVLDRLIPARSNCSMVAPGGSRKSLLMLAVAVAVATGRQRFAGLTIPRRRRVLYVDMELTRQDLADRLTDLGVMPDTDLSDLVYLHLPPLAPLDTFNGGAELAAILDAYRIGDGDLLVLDSTQRVVAGPENDADTWRAYYRHTVSGLKRRGVAVVRTDNTGKDPERGGRGSASKMDEVDVEWRITTAGVDRERLILTPAKQRIPDVRALSIDVVSDRDGRVRFTTLDDPFSAAVREATAILDALDFPPDGSQNAAEKAVRAADPTLSRAVNRSAHQARRGAP